MTPASANGGRQDAKDATMTGPELLAVGLGITPRRGDERCFYCGAWCDGANLARVSSTFTERARAADPSSPFRCDGCEAAMDEKAMLPEREKPQKIRNYSWLATETQSVPLTKADRERILRLCLDPPDPPWALAISDSGQRHLMFKTPVNIDPHTPTVTFEGEPVAYRPGDLRDRVELATRLAAAAGKPALREPAGVRLALAVADYWGWPHRGQPLMNRWERVQGKPLSRLAAWLVPPQKECRIAYPNRNV